MKRATRTGDEGGRCQAGALRLPTLPPGATRARAALTTSTLSQQRPEPDSYKQRISTRSRVVLLDSSGPVLPLNASPASTAQRPSMHASASNTAGSAYPTPIPPAANLAPTEPFEYGEAVFHARRAAWLAHGAGVSSSSRTAGSAGSSSKRLAAAQRPSAGAEASLRRLEELLALCDQGAGDDIPSGLWKAGLENVHRGLIGGRSESTLCPTKEATQSAERSMCIRARCAHALAETGQPSG
jgi:hypothetical protein